MYHTSKAITTAGVDLQVLCRTVKLSIRVVAITDRECEHSDT